MRTRLSTVEKLPADEWRWYSSYQVPVSYRRAERDGWDRFDLFQSRLETSCWAYQFVRTFEDGTTQTSKAVAGFALASTAFSRAWASCQAGTVPPPAEGSDGR